MNNEESNDGSFTKVYTSRASVRHFGDSGLSFDEASRLVEIARWAPSAGNLQPWRVVYLDQNQTASLRSVCEWEGYQSALPTALDSVKKHSGLRGDQAIAKLFKIYQQELKATGNPSALVVYGERWTLRRYLHFAGLALEILLGRLRRERGVFRKGRIILQTLLRAPRDLFLAHEVEAGGMTAFLFGLTLAAQAQGYSSCLQSCYQRTFWKLLKLKSINNNQRLSRARHRIFGVVLLSKTGQGVGLGSLDTRRRNDVKVGRL